MQLWETDTGLVFAGGQPLQVYGQATLILDLGSGFVIPHCIFASYWYELSVQLWGACWPSGWPAQSSGSSCQMVNDGKWIDD